MDKARAKKLTGMLLNVAMCVFLAVAVFAVFLTVFSRKNPDGAAVIFGHEMRIVTSHSMEKCEQTNTDEWKIKDIPYHSMIFVETVPEDADEATEWYRDLREGDVLTFRYLYATQLTITHRVKGVIEKPTGGFIISLEGDNKSYNADQLYQEIDTSIPNNPNYVIGKVVGQSHLLGLVVNFLSHPVSIALIVILPCLCIVFLEVAKIMRIVTADKREKEAAAARATEEELIELRRRVAELEAKKSEAGGTETDREGEAP